MTALPRDRRPTRALLPVLLMAPAELAVHQLRYTLAFGGRTGLELTRTGHAYLHSLAPWVILLLATALGLFLRAIGRAFAGHRSGAGYTLSLGALWLFATAGLLFLYGAQESLEGLLAAGHPGGAAAILGAGGWWAVPVAACIGLVLAALFHGALWVVQEIAVRRAPASRAPRRSRTAPHRLPRVALGAPAPAPLVAGWSDRGPPFAGAPA